MKQFLLWLALFLSLTTAGRGQSQPPARIQLANPGPVALTDAVVDIPWATVLAAYPSVDTARLRVVQLPAGRERPYQLEWRGQKTVQTLLVQVSVGPRQRIVLALLPQTPAPVAARTYCRYVPERFDDFAWENNRVAFRIYGHALDGRKDNAYGTDVWAKRTDQLVINKWYRSGDYHKDHGEGLDYYHVGLTLGAGDVGVWLNDSIRSIHNYTTWQVLDNGPLRSTFRVSYPAYSFGGTTVNTTKIISLDAGSQLSRIEVQVSHSYPVPLPMVVGVSLHPQPGTVRTDEQAGILSYWEPVHGADGTLGIGCVIPARTGPVVVRQAQQHLLGEVPVRSGEPLVYYAGAAWDKAGLFTSATDWFAYLSQYAAQRRQPPVVSAQPAIRSGPTRPRPGR